MIRRSTIIPALPMFLQDGRQALFIRQKRYLGAMCADLVRA
jgi:hypothetical protein